MLNLDDAIRSRHSTRMFLPQKPVPRERLEGTNREVARRLDIAMATICSVLDAHNA